MRIGHKHTLAHDRERYRPPARSWAHPIGIWMLRGARVFWVETARPGCIAHCMWLAGLRDVGLCVVKIYIIARPDSLFTTTVTDS